MNKKITVASVIMVSFLIIGAGYDPNPKTKLNTGKNYNTKITSQKDEHKEIKNKLQLATGVSTNNKVEQEICKYLSREKVNKLNSISSDKIKKAGDQYKEKWVGAYFSPHKNQNVNLGNQLTVEVIQNNRKAEEVYSGIVSKNGQTSGLDITKQVHDSFKLIQNSKDESQAKYLNNGVLLILKNKASFAIKSLKGGHEYKTAREIRKNVAKNFEDKKGIYSSIIKQCKK